MTIFLVWQPRSVIDILSGVAARSLQTDLLGVRSHAVYTYPGDLAHFHAEHSAALFYELAVAFCGEFLILEFLHKALDAEVGDTVRAHTRQDMLPKI